MNFQDSLYFSLAAYANIHPNRAAALNHFFCVNGNGYEWVNGQLVDSWDGRPGESLKQHISRTFRARKKRDKFRIKWKKKHENDPTDSEIDSKIDEILNEALEKMRKAKEADPEKFERDAKESERRYQESLAAYEESKKWDYAVPDNMEERLQNTDFNNWYPMSPNKSYGACFYHFTKLLDFPEDIQPDWLDALIETSQLILAHPNKADRYINEAGVAQNQEIAKKALLTALKFKEAAFLETL